MLPANTLIQLHKLLLQIEIRTNEDVSRSLVRHSGGSDGNFKCRTARSKRKLRTSKQNVCVGIAKMSVTGFSRGCAVYSPYQALLEIVRNGLTYSDASSVKLYVHHREGPLR